MKDYTFLVAQKCINIMKNYTFLIQQKCIKKNFAGSENFLVPMRKARASSSGFQRIYRIVKRDFI